MGNHERSHLSRHERSHLSAKMVFVGSPLGMASQVFAARHAGLQPLRTQTSPSWHPHLSSHLWLFHSTPCMRHKYNSHQRSDKCRHHRSHLSSHERSHLNAKMVLVG